MDDTVPGRWIGRRGAIEYPPRTPDLTLQDFHLWGSLKNEVYQQKPATRDALRESIAVSCAVITPGTLTAVVRSVDQRHRRCLAVNGGHLTHKMTPRPLTSVEKTLHYKTVQEF